jgi:hypothetical protein
VAVVKGVGEVVESDRGVPAHVQVAVKREGLKVEIDSFFRACCPTFVLSELVTSDLSVLRREEPRR